MRHLSPRPPPDGVKPDFRKEYLDVLDRRGILVIDHEGATLGGTGWLGMFSNAQRRDVVEDLENWRPRRGGPR